MRQQSSACHDPDWPLLPGWSPAQHPDYRLPDLKTCIEANLDAARLTNPAAVCIGVSVNTSQMAPEAAEAFLKATEDELGLPTVDAFKDGVAPIVDRLV